MKQRITTLLLWAQKYTKIDMLYLAHGGFWTVLSQTINGLLSLGLIIAFANLISKETYGSYRYILSIASILNIFTLTGIGTAISRSVARGNEVLRGSISYQLKWNMFMVFGFFAVSLYYFLHDNIVYGYSFLVLSVFVPASIAFNTYGSYLEGKKEFKSLNINRVLSTIVYSAGTLITLFLGGEVIWLIAMYACTTFLAAFFSYLHTLKKFAHPDSTNFNETARFGRELTYVKFIDPIASQIDKIVLAHFWGPAQLATYALATAIPNRAILFMKSWINIGFPKFATRTTKMIDSVFYGRILQGMAVGVLFMLGYVIMAPLFFTYILPQYVDGIFYSQLFSITFIFALPNRYISLLLTAQGLSRIIFIRSIINSVLNILLYVCLGIWGGLLGLVSAAILSSVINLFMNISLWKKYAHGIAHSQDQ